MEIKNLKRNPEENNGWSYDYGFIQKLSDATKNSEYPVGMEEVESVLKSFDKILNEFKPQIEEREIRDRDKEIISMYRQERSETKCIGELIESEHPDEIHPRAETWLQERRNWMGEVEILKKHIEEINSDRHTLEQVISFGYYSRKNPNTVMRENYLKWKDEFKAAYPRK